MGRVRPQWTAPGTVAATRSSQSSGVRSGRVYGDAQSIAACEWSVRFGGYGGPGWR